MGGSRLSPLERISFLGSVAATRLPATAYRVAARMIQIATDGSGTVWESRPNLARAINCDEARLPAAFRALELAGFIQPTWHPLRKSHPVGWAHPLRKSQRTPCGSRNEPPAEVAPQQR